MDVIKKRDYIHEYFGLSYAEYLVVPRSVLQSMPENWQKRFVGCMEELWGTIDWFPQEGTYKVTLNEIVEEYDEAEDMFIEKWGRELYDPLQNYNRERRRIPYRNNIKK